jgi:hypothetical protein
VDSIPVTYFQKSPSIRVIPYATVALIGLPYWYVSEPEVLLAVPHEVGHYVFWNGREPGRSGAHGRRCYLFHRLPQLAVNSKLPQWSRKWLEEAFADVFGGRLAGAMIALDFQDIQLPFADRLFVKDDGEHPAPFVRPLIYTSTLRRMGYGDWAAALERRWTEILLATRPRVTKFTPRDEEAIEIDTLDARLDKLVTLSNDMLEGISFDSEVLKRKFAGGPPDADAPDLFTELDKLDESWRDQLGWIGDDPASKLRPEAVAKLCRSEWHEEKWIKWRDDLVEDSLEVQPLNADNRTSEEISQMRADREWHVVLNAGGWTDGPGDGPKYP